MYRSNPGSLDPLFKFTLRNKEKDPFLLNSNCLHSSDKFLESPNNFSGPDLSFKIGISGKVEYFLACKPVQLVLSTYKFIPAVSFQNLQNMNLK